MEYAISPKETGNEVRDPDRTMLSAQLCLEHHCIGAVTLGAFNVMFQFYCEHAIVWRISRRA